MIDLIPFCDVDVPSLAKPWIHEEWCYATNGRILVRVNAAEVEAEPWDETTRKRPRLELGHVFEDPQDRQPFEFSFANCRICRGKVVYKLDCRECYGSGEHECPCGCGGYHQCGYCCGQGKITDYCDHSRSIAGVKCDDLYLVKMHAIGVSSVAQSDDKHSIQFWFPNGRGVLMGLV